jgi:hypothetical protein
LRNPGISAIVSSLSAQKPPQAKGETDLAEGLGAARVNAFNRADAKAVAAFYDEDAIHHQAAESPVSGRATIRATFEREFAATEMVCIVEALYEDDEVAIPEWRDPLWVCADAAFFTSATAKSPSNAAIGTN